MRMVRPLRFALLTGALALLSGCAATQKAFDAMEKAGNAAHQRHMADFPDQSLLSVYLDASGDPAPRYACGGCTPYLKRPDDRAFDFLTIDRPSFEERDLSALARQSSLNPLEFSDVGELFAAHAVRRGNQVAVYGAPVNARFIRTARPYQPQGQGSQIFNDLSSTMVEIDPNGAFVSILAVGFEVNRSIIVTDSPNAKNLISRQQIFVLPYSTARYVQERTPAGFMESYRIR